MNNWFPRLVRCVLVLPFAWIIAPAQSAELTNTTSPPAIVIVHGAWGGAHHWRAVAEELTDSYHGLVRRASLTGLGERSHLASPEITLDTHVQDVVNLIDFDGYDSVILIGHSYGGLVAQGVVDVMPERIAVVYYLDTHLLKNGETYFTHHAERQAQAEERAAAAGDGYLIPVDWNNPMRDTPHPLATLTQPISLSNPKRNDVPAHYWLFTDHGPAEKDSRFRYYKRAEQRGYDVKQFSWGHNPHRKQPTVVAAELIQAFGAHLAE